MKEKRKRKAWLFLGTTLRLKGRKVILDKFVAEEEEDSKEEKKNGGKGGRGRAKGG